jgi:regulatory protein
MAVRGKPKKLDSEGLWDYALDALGRQAQSAGQIRQKLTRRAQTPSDVADVLAKLREYNLVNDRKFSEGFATSRLQNQGFGRFRVLRELQAKQVANSVAKEAVEKTFADTDEPELAANFLARKFRGTDLREYLKDEKNLASAYRRLRTAGFSTRSSVDVLRRYTSQLEDFEESEAED